MMLRAVALALALAVHAHASPVRNYLAQVLNTQDKLHVRVVEEERGQALLSLADYLRPRLTLANASCHSGNGVVGDARHLFEVTSDGRLRNATGDLTRLDREQLCNETRPTAALCWLNLTAMYCGLMVEVAIEVADVNDWQPAFATHETLIEFSEADEPPNWKRLPIALDRDSATFAVRRYLLRKPNASDPFCLAIGRKNPPRCEVSIVWNPNSTELNLVLYGRLDRETRPEYRLELVAEDGLNRSHLNITVVVNDVNDHTPKFAHAAYSVSHQELPHDSQQDVVLIQLAATDADAGDNAEITYAIEWALQDDVNNFLEVNDVGEVRARSPIMDFERQASFSFRVLASDNKHAGQPSRTGTTEVTVNLQDINDNAPTIRVDALDVDLASTSDNVVLSVSENGPEQQFVAKVTVADADSNENGRVVCDMSPDAVSKNVFQVVPSEVSRRVEYQIKTKRAFDRETTSEYSLDVRCHDNGNPQLASALRLTVRVTDVNDNAPKFGTATYDLQVAEDTQAEQTITSFDVTDKDEGTNANLFFWLDVDERTPFKVQDGKLLLTSQLDREACENYTFTVHVRDLGRPSLSSSASVRLRVTDVNDNAPQLDPVLAIDVQENIKSDSLPHLIYTVKVRDVDAPGTPNSNISFMLLEDGPFILDKNGNLFLNALLDRETRPSYQFQLLASDNGNPPLTSTCTVTVSVTDANDMPPVFIYPLNNRTVVRAPATLDLPIVTFEARDGDGPGDNSRVRYALIGGDEDLFVINDTSGQLFLRRHLSSGIIRQVRLSASDGGRPVMSSTITHTIELVGVPQVVPSDNDYIPLNNAAGSSKERTDTIYIICAIVIGISACLAIFIIILILIRSRRERDHRTHADEESSKKRSGAGAGSGARSRARKPNGKRPHGRTRPQSRTGESVQHSHVFNTADYRVQGPKTDGEDAEGELEKLTCLPMPVSPLNVEYDMETASRSTQMRAGLMPGAMLLNAQTPLAIPPQFPAPPCGTSGTPKMNSFCLECDACMQTLKANMQTPMSNNRTDHYQFSRPSSSATLKRQNEFAQLTYQPNSERRSTSAMLRRLETASSNRYDMQEEANQSEDSYESDAEAEAEAEWHATKDGEPLTATDCSVNEQPESMRLLNANVAGNSECNNNSIQRIVTGMMSNASVQRSRAKSAASGAQPIAVHEVTPFVFDLQPHTGTGPFETLSMAPNATLGMGMHSGAKTFKNLNFEHSFV